MSKKIFSKEQYEDKLLSGIQKIDSILSQTLGPKGKHVVYDKFDTVHVVDDGTTIADQIEFEDLVENAIAKLISKSSREANNLVGDGSTTTSVLSCALIKSGMKFAKLGFNTAFIRKGLEKVSSYLVAELGKIAKPIGSNGKDIESVARIASGDAKIGQLIGMAVTKVGLDGLVTVQEGNSFDTTIELTIGLEIDKGMLSPYFSSSADKNEFFVTNPSIFITDQSINSPEQTFKLLENLLTMQSNGLIIIAEDIKPEALMLLLANKFKKGLNICAVKAPSFGENRREILQDLCVATGATLFAKEAGCSFNNITHEVFGSAASVKVTNDKTTIICDEHSREDILKRQAVLKEKLSELTGQFEKNKLLERVAKLSGSIAVINVGASTEAEMKSKKLKIEDALNATKAAIQEGVVSGGGVTLLKLSSGLIDGRDSVELINDEKCALDIFAEALSQPLKHILNNAGAQTELIVHGLNVNKEDNMGFDVVNLRYVNMLDEGILDCAKVLRTAIQTSASIAGMLLTSGAAILVSDKKEETQQPEVSY